MPYNTQVTGGMLNGFVYNQRTPYENIMKKGPNLQKPTTVKQLDKEMRAATDAGILKKGRAMQKSFDIGRGKAVMV